MKINYSGWVQYKESGAPMTTAGLRGDEVAGAGSGEPPKAGSGDTWGTNQRNSRGEEGTMYETRWI
jgi:hypothetical protein